MSVMHYFVFVSLLVVLGCAAPPHHRIVGRWTVAGTDQRLVLAKDGTAQLTRQGNTVSGTYRMGAPDVLILTFPGPTPTAAPETLGFIIRAQDWASRTVQRP